MKTNSFMLYALEVVFSKSLRRQSFCFRYSNILEQNVLDLDDIIFGPDDVSVLNRLSRFTAMPDVRAFCLDAIKFLKSK